MTSRQLPIAVPKIHWWSSAPCHWAAGSPLSARSSSLNFHSPHQEPLNGPFLDGLFSGQCFGNPNPYNLSKKVRQYTSNLYGSTPPHLYRRTFLASMLRRKGNPPISLPFVLQYASHLYSTTPPFVRQYFGKILGVGVTGTFLSFPGCFKRENGP